jgi:hypothetical protein
VTAWVTIFDEVLQPFRWGNAGEGLAAFALVALGASASMALHRRGARGGTAILAAAAGLAVFFAVRTLDHRRAHDACMEAARRGNGRVIEGVVEDFHPLRSVWQRPWYESFVVGGVTVRYPLLSQGCGFHRTMLEGGPIREGMRVRLREWKGEILKVEIDRASMEPPPHRHPPL